MFELSFLLLCLHDIAVEEQLAGEVDLLIYCRVNESYEHCGVTRIS